MHRPDGYCPPLANQQGALCSPRRVPRLCVSLHRGGGRDDTLKKLRDWSARHHHETTSYSREPSGQLNRQIGAESRSAGTGTLPSYPLAALSTLSSFQSSPLSSPPFALLETEVGYLLNHKSLSVLSTVSQTAPFFRRFPALWHSIWGGKRKARTLLQHESGPRNGERKRSWRAAKGENPHLFGHKVRHKRASRQTNETQRPDSDLPLLEEAPKPVRRAFSTVYVCVSNHAT